MKTIEPFHVTVESKSIYVEIRKLQVIFLSDKQKIMIKQYNLLRFMIGLKIIRALL